MFSFAVLELLHIQLLETVCRFVLYNICCFGWRGMMGQQREQVSSEHEYTHNIHYKLVYRPVESSYSQVHYIDDVA